MKYLPLLWSGIWRKPGRTILIFLQIAVAFSLFGVLQGLATGVQHAVRLARADLLLVHSRLNLWEPLPLGMLAEIQSLPGVHVVVPVSMFFANYRMPTQHVGVVAIQSDKGWESAFTYHIAAKYLAALRKSRIGALARVELAKKYGWKIGERITLISDTKRTNGSTSWAFDLVGTYTDSDVGSGSDVILINYAYFNEARASDKGTVNHFNVSVSDPKQAAAVAEEIDHRFANSPNETETDSLRALAQMELQSIGNLNFVIRAIISAVLVALLFATATTMIQSFRERRPELAVLKTLGFTDLAVFLLILFEALVVCVTAAACGLALATLVFPMASRFVPGLSMPPIIVEVGLASAVAVALISAAVPAVAAARLEVAAALADR